MTTRPLYSFQVTQHGRNLIIDACVPMARAQEFMNVLQERAGEDGATVLHKKSPFKLKKNPEFQIRSINPPWTKSRKPPKRAPAVKKVRRSAPQAAG